MYYKKLLIGIAAMLLAIINNALAQCDPNDPSCVCTNSDCYSYTNHWDPIVWPAGSLQLWVANTGTNIAVTLTNGSLYSDYVLEESTNLVSWSVVGDRFEVGTNLAKTFYFPSDSQYKFYRAKDDTIVLLEEAVSISPETTCVGTTHAISYFLKEAPAFGWAPETNMVRHFAVDGYYNTNNAVYYDGRIGDNSCGAGKVEVTPLYSSTYRFGIYFPTAPTNDYPIRLKGFKR